MSRFGRHTLPIDALNHRTHDFAEEPPLRPLSLWAPSVEMSIILVVMELRVHVQPVRAARKAVVSQVLPADMVHCHASLDNVVGQWLQRRVVGQHKD
jgi:hypothetical protein